MVKATTGKEAHCYDYYYYYYYYYYYHCYYYYYYYYYYYHYYYSPVPYSPTDMSTCSGVGLGSG